MLYSALSRSRSAIGNRRRGRFFDAFTLVELIVVLGVTAILASLLLAAALSAREAARRARCATNLKQLGLALHGYVGSHGTFPNGENRSHLVAILPHLDAPYVYDAYNQQCRANDYANRTVQRHQLGLLLCPTQPLPSHDAPKPGRTCYAGNRGSGSWEDMLDGVLGYPAIRPDDIIDGTANTALMSEWVAAVGSGVELGLVYRVPEDHLTGREEFVTACFSDSIRFERMPSVGRNWTSTSFASTVYLHQLEPNGPSCNAHGFPLNKLAFSAGSLHSGGANALFADGGVRWVSDRVDREIWRAAGSRNGGETLPAPF